MEGTSQETPSLSPERTYLKKYQKPILAAVVMIIAVIVLVSPIIPIKYTVTQTRTRNVRYNQVLYDKIVFGNDVGPYFVEVTNQDSIDGSFQVTMNWWRNTNPLSQSRVLEDKFSKSLLIKAGAKERFYLPDDWAVVEPMYSLTYSVSAPTTQEAYNVTKTKYKSLLDLIRGS